MPKPFALQFTPPFKTDIDVPNLDPAPNLLQQSRLAHVGLRYITVVRVSKNKEGKQQREQIYRIDITDAEPGHTPKFSPELIASTCAAMAIEDATERSKTAYYLVTFYGCRSPGSTKAPYRFAQFKGSPRDEEEVDTEAEDGEDGEGGDEEGEEEGDEGEEEEEEEEEPQPPGAQEGAGEQEDDEPIVRAPRLVGDAGAGQPWNSYARPGDLHEPLAPRIQHTLPEQRAAAFPPGAMPPEPTPAQLGNMTTQTHGGMEHYAAMMHPAQALFLHHLGGVFAETRASMREMRQDVREARAEAKNAIERLITMSSMGSAHLEAMHKSNQIGWDAMHQGQTMQLNALQNSMAWERRIMELQHGQQGGSTAMTIVQVLMALVPQVIAGVAMLKGATPEMAQMLGGMAGGAMPGAMPGLPGAPGGPAGAPPGFVPPSSPPPGFAPPSAPPPPGFNGHGGPPMGFASPDAPPPGFHNGHDGPPGGFAMPPSAPPEPTSVQFRPSSPSDPMSTPPASPMGPGPFAAIPPSGPMGPGPFGVMHQMPPAPMGAVPSQDAMRERFQQAPYCAMVEALLVSTSRNGGQQRLIAAGCGHVVHALEIIRGAENDHVARDRFVELGRLLSMPGVVETAVQQLAPGEERHMLMDLRDIMSRFVQRQPISFDAARAPSLAWQPPSPPAPPPMAASPMASMPMASMPMASMPTAPTRPMQLVPDGMMPTMSMPSSMPAADVVAPAVAAETTAPALDSVHVDDDVQVEATVDGKMRTPARGSKRRTKITPRPAH